MLRRSVFASVWVGLIFLLGGGAAAAPEGGPVWRVSVAALTGVEGNKMSQFPDISADGRFIVFASDATNLVASDTNNASDIFLHDGSTGQTELISQRSDGGRANGSSYSPTVSDDGRYVAYHSFATNLVDGDSNGLSDVFLYDRTLGETFLVSFVIGGTANDVSFEPDISGNGRYIAFYSYATNLVGGDSNDFIDVFRYDHLARVMERVSLDSNEVEANGSSRSPSISDDGQKIAFESSASNLVTGDANTYTDIFVRNMAAGTTARVSLNSDEVEGNGASTTPAISGDGNTVAFLSLANNLVSGDTNSYQDVFVRDVIATTTERVSIATNGTQPNRSSNHPAISDDGRYVAFHTFADNLVPGKTIFAQDVFVYDRQNDALRRESESADDEPGNNSSRQAALSGDGRYITYLSEASNLIPNDTNGVADIFVHDRQDPAELSIDYLYGYPSSHFIITGRNYRPLFTAEVRVNGVLLGLASTDNNGNLSVRLITTVDTQEGLYYVEVSQSGIAESVVFTVANDAPIRSGSGPGFTVNNSIPPYNNQVYLPSVLGD